MRFFGLMILAACTLFFSGTTVLSADRSFLKVKKTSGFSASDRDKVQLRAPLDPRKLEQSLLESKDQREFDQKEWRECIDNRQYMLLSLFRRNLFKKSVEEVRKILGEPDFVDDSTREHFECYRLGNYMGENLALRIFYNELGLRSFFIAQPSDLGYLYLFPGDWHFQNMNLRDAATAFNKHFHLVGAPTQHLCQFIGHPTKVDNVWRCGYIELEYSPDKKKVARFRFSPSSQGLFDFTTDWVSEDLRTVVGSYSTAYDFLNLSSQSQTLLVQPSSKFSIAEWRNDVRKRATMLFDIVHSYLLIGMKRQNIHEIFGDSYYDEVKLDPDNVRTAYFRNRLLEKDPFNKFDWFGLCGTGCISPAEPGRFLELVYKHDSTNGEVVAGYRILETDKYSDKKRIISGQSFDWRYGYCEAETNLRSDGKKR